MWEEERQNVLLTKGSVWWVARPRPADHLSTQQLTNIVVRLSSRQLPDSKKDAILVNAHLDSTLPSPGAADDLAGVSVMVRAPG